MSAKTTDWGVSPAVDRIYDAMDRTHHLDDDLVDNAMYAAKSLEDFLNAVEAELDLIERDVQTMRDAVKKAKEAQA